MGTESNNNSDTSKRIVAWLYTLIHNYFFVTGCILFVLSLPFKTRITNVAIIIMTVGWIMNGNITTKWKNFKQTKCGWGIFVFFLICVLSAFYSENLDASISKLETKISLLILPLIIFSSSLSGKNISRVLYCFVIAMFFTALYCLGSAAFRYAATGEINNFFYQWFTIPLHLSAIYFANFLCMGVIILIFYRDGELFQAKWKFYLIATMIIFILMLAALSVTGFLVCLGAVSGWYFFRSRFTFLKSLLLLSFCSLMFVTLIWVFPYTKTKVEKMTNLHYHMNYPDSMWNTVTIRLAKWKGALAVIKQHPTFGVGIGDEYDALMESYAMLNFSEGIRNTYNEHNQYLASLVATGMPGFIALLAMLAIPFRRALVYRDYLFLAFLTLMLFSFMTENFLYIQKGVLFFAFFYAILIKRLLSQKEARMKNVSDSI
jgi:O-antigen ligase